MRKPCQTARKKDALAVRRVYLRNTQYWSAIGAALCDACRVMPQRGKGARVQRDACTHPYSFGMAIFVMAAIADK
jgi:hypothetical protein